MACLQFLKPAVEIAPLPRIVHNINVMQRKKQANGTGFSTFHSRDEKLGNWMNDALYHYFPVPNPALVLLARHVLDERGVRMSRRGEGLHEDLLGAGAPLQSIFSTLYLFIYFYLFFFNSSFINFTNTLIEYNIKSLIIEFKIYFFFLLSLNLNFFFKFFLTVSMDDSLFLQKFIFYQKHFCKIKYFINIFAKISLWFRPSPYRGDWRLNSRQQTSAVRGCDTYGVVGYLSNGQKKSETITI